MDRQNSLIWAEGQTVLDLYEVKQLLGQGGMGIVQRVHHKTWNLDLAVKSPRENIFTSEDGIENFINEAETWVSLGLHPNVVDCYYVRIIDGLPRVFIELVDGGSLKDWIDSGKLYKGSHSQVLVSFIDIAIQFAWGLHFAHELGLIHQDVKPANIMMTPSGVAKVTDFGLAKARFIAGEKIESSLEITALVTVSGMTPAYCSPEQADGLKLSRRTDIWSWAVSVLQMLTGEIIWASGPLAGLVLLGIDGQNKNLRFSVPDSIIKILNQCLSFEPSDRPATLKQVAEMLKEVYLQVVGEEYSRLEPDLISSTADNLNNQALSLFDLGYEDRALEIWNKALAISPLHLDSIYNSSLTEWRKAILTDNDLLRKVQNAKHSSSDTGIGNYFEAQIHMERGDAQTAIQLIEDAKSLTAVPKEAQELLEFARTQVQSSCKILRKSAIGGKLLDFLLDENAEFALVSSKNNVVLWDINKASEIRSFIGHDRRVFCATFSDNGKYVLSGSDDTTVKLWDVKTGKCLRTFRGHHTKIASVKFRSDNFYALSCGGHGYQSFDDVIRLWDIRSGECLGTLKGHDRVVSDVCFSPNGKYAVSGSWDHTLRLWDLTNGKCLKVFEGHEDWVTSVDFSKDSRFILSGGCDNTIRFWDAISGECIRKMITDGEVSSVSLRFDSKYALSTSPLKLWNLKTGRCQITFEDGGKIARFSEDGIIAIYGGSHGLITDEEFLKFRNLATPSYVAPFHLSRIISGETTSQHKKSFDLHISKAINFLEHSQINNARNAIKQARKVSGFERHPKAIKLWSQLYENSTLQTINDVWESLTFNDYEAGVEFTAISDNCHVCLTGSQYFNERTGKNDVIIKLSDIKKGKHIKELNLKGLDVSIARLSKDGNYLVTGGKGHTVSLWSLKSDECLWIEQGEENYTFDMAISPDSKLLLILTSSDKGNSRFIQLRDLQGKVLHTINIEDVTSVNFSSDGKYFITSSATWNDEINHSEYVLKLWNLSTFKIEKESVFKNESIVDSVCVTPDSQSVLIGSVSGGLELRDLKTGQLIHSLDSSDGGGYAIDISSDGRFAVSTASNCSIKIWDLKTGQCLKTLLGHSMNVSSLCISANGQYILSGSRDCSAKLWFLDWEL